ncbi:hypothetical protein EDB19DRAFT_1824822 [Suillus lakei]|nr:hypothetical protein EDB19DRAFT_1824822 [Suillus lakei]
MDTVAESSPSSARSSLHAESNHLQFAVTGRPIVVGTKIDPTVCRADCVTGQVLGVVGKLLKVYTEDKKQTKVSKLTKNELLLINIGSTPTGGRVLRASVSVHSGDLAFCTSSTWELVESYSVTPKLPQ